MPTIDHKDQPSIPASPMPPAAVPSKVAAAPTITDLEKQIKQIMEKRAADAAEATKPKAPNWATITEADIANPAVYIPVVEHDIPDYMNVKLLDDEYVPVWANKDQRRLGALLAEGYELLKKEHIHPRFQVPLVWSSEGTYLYADVICLRVHKSILYSKRRKSLEISQKQLKNTNKTPKSRFTPDDDIQLGPGMDLYETSV